MLSERVLEIMVCPVSKAPLEYRPENQELICKTSGLAYPIRDGIPVMLEHEARRMTPEEAH
jgi:uncharacterized protein